MAKQNILVIVAVLAVAFLALKGTGVLGAIGAGGTTLSITDAKASDGYITVTTVLNGNGQYLEATLDNQLLSQYGITLNEPVKIKADLTRQSCSYAVQEREQFISQASGAECVSPIASVSSCGQCISKVTRRVCMIPTWRIASPSSYVNYDFLMNVTIETANGTIVQSKKIDPTTSVIDLGDGQTVTFTGGLVGTQSCPTPSTTTVLIRSVSGGNYKPIDKLMFDSYASALLFPVFNFPVIPDCGAYGNHVCKYSTSDNQNLQAANNFMSQYTTYADKVISSTPIGEPVCVIQNTSGTTTYSCNPIQPAYLPVLVWKIKTNAVVSKAGSGTPEIMSISTPVSVESSTLLYNISVKNTGSSTEPATFEVSLSCPYNVSWRANKLSLKGGETGTTELEVSGFASEQKCVLTAYDLNKPELKDTQEIQVKIQLRQCPDSFECCQAGAVAYLPKDCPIVVIPEDCEYLSGTINNTFFDQSRPNETQIITVKLKNGTSYPYEVPRFLSGEGVSICDMNIYQLRCNSNICLKDGATKLGTYKAENQEGNTTIIQYGDQVFPQGGSVTAFQSFCNANPSSEACGGSSASAVLNGLVKSIGWGGLLALGAVGAYLLLKKR